jgi:hypothetical protein
MPTAVENRHAWRAAIAEGRQPDVPEPRARPVPTFEGGKIAFVTDEAGPADLGHARRLGPRVAASGGVQGAGLFQRPGQFVELRHAQRVPHPAGAEQETAVRRDRQPGVEEVLRIAVLAASEPLPRLR